MFWITTIVLILSLNESCQSKSHLRIRDGRDAKEGEFPYVVVLVIYDNQTSRFETRMTRFCTGSILSQDWVLTAGHCCKKKLLRFVYVWYANFTNTIPPMGNKFIKKVRKMFLHPRFIHSEVKGTILNDLCLMLVDQLPTNSFGRLLAVDHFSMIGLPVMYVGGGITNKPGDDQLRPLQVGEAGIVSCSEEEEILTLQYMICIVPKCVNRFHMAWHGDSGGPLLYDGRIIGVCTAGTEFNPRILEGFYSAISPHMHWIHNVMQHKYDQTTPSIPANN